MSDNTKLTDVIMPQLAESLVSATIGKWLKQPGDTIEQYEPICELITDKVNAELPATVDGTLVELLAEEGQTVSVGEIIARIAVAGAAAPAASAAAPAAANAAATAASGAAPQPAHASVRPSVPAAAFDADAPMRSRYSPAVQTLAAEHGINLAAVPGTGLGGRITRKDVLAFLESGAAAAQPAATAPTAAAPAPQQPVFQPIQEEVRGELQHLRHSGLHLSESPKIPTIEVEGGRGSSSEYLIDVTPIRNTIATRMRQSVSEIPHAWTMIEVDVTNLVVLRNKLKDEFKRKEGINLTYLAFLMKAVVSAIKDYPIMNSVWAVDKIIVKRDINISLAVGTEDSVMTPVIKKADQKNVAGLAREIDELALKTREGKLRLEDMQGGTFTVNNTGSFGSILSYPIINYPQAAILTFESIVKKPVVINDMIAVRSMANICLSLDHRILDGVISGRFLQRVKDNVEGYTPDTKLY
ncbi:MULTISPECIES: dihydrolipoamide acetyltransferase family protein [unclassified Paenibacillus]|uniref:dihydrolipoamide acetyltransferase family protein n=1 Tax=unclassified Paenibacillus TaxID=185978 RepID=UPI0004F8C130|nr:MULTISPECIES: dihydrolipoamide acetyltransferase family protein [unclassified Paenibacillus]AIQ30955.1 branched-chain alpha-keto acid dehydrogenase subunit E2 [Paenibacillus sp. FSL P4-0081]OMF25405.1 branched-chain alpha-keto acid dehydrogenase subunit E2 [Paenibacillus sp. FSL H8-0259]